MPCQPRGRCLRQRRRRHRHIRTHAIITCRLPRLSRFECSVVGWLGGWVVGRQGEGVENHPTTQPPNHPTTQPPNHLTTYHEGRLTTLPDTGRLQAVLPVARSTASRRAVRTAGASSAARGTPPARK